MIQTPTAITNSKPHTVDNRALATSLVVTIGTLALVIVIVVLFVVSCSCTILCYRRNKMKRGLREHRMTAAHDQNELHMNINVSYGSFHPNNLPYNDYIPTTANEAYLIQYTGL